MKPRNLVVLSSLLTLVAFGSGCGRIVGESIGAARGAHGLYAPILMVSEDPEARPLGQYKQFELGQITDDFGGKVPPDFMMYFTDAFAHQLAEKKLPDEPGKTLLIRGKILHYEDASRLGSVISPLEEVVARIELVDKDSGRVIGVANCIGRTMESINAGVAKKAEGLAKAIVGWLDKEYPKEGRE